MFLLLRNLVGASPDVGTTHHRLRVASRLARTLAHAARWIDSTGKTTAHAELQAAPVTGSNMPNIGGSIALVGDRCRGQ
ncbi:hypothetical protein OU995_09830 [Roseateles sp. SL47]|uniref:hypothetical protein n=1 Tax=Roseateles sp. SL47 TaxID=2995138 RepID=UPI00226EDB79|nr:hypothetical protein [Roseateles sp. SL47]WAC74964.1 hypothetical protein OU995_09830 [Roseateles sp. SL47]